MSWLEAHQIYWERCFLLNKMLEIVYLYFNYCLNTNISRKLKMIMESTSNQRATKNMMGSIRDEPIREAVRTFLLEKNSGYQRH